MELTDTDIKLLDIKYIYLVFLPLARTKPPKAKSMTSANEPNVLATVKLLPTPAMNRNNPEAI